VELPQPYKTTVERETFKNMMRLRISCLLTAFKSKCRGYYLETLSDLNRKVLETHEDKKLKELENYKRHKSSYPKMRSEKNILVQRNSSNENSDFLDFIFSGVLILMYRNHEEVRIQYSGRKGTLKILDLYLTVPS